MAIEATSLSEISAHIQRDVAPISLRGQLYGGVSGSVVYSGLLYEPTQTKRVVLKHDKGVGPKEVKGIKVLSHHLPVPDVIHHGANHVLLPFIAGETLDSIAGRRPDSQDQVRTYIEAHVRLWENSSGAKDQVVGYPEKLGSTRQLVLNTSLQDAQGRQVSLGDISRKELIINGHNIGSLEEVLEVMENSLGASQSPVLSHGDEGFGNCIVDKKGGMTMIDCGTAGVRNIGEPMAKIAMWLPATRLQPRGYSLGSFCNEVRLDTNALLDTRVQQTIMQVESELGKVASGSDMQREVAANRMMYLFRETQWLAKRGKEELRPYLISLALTHAQVLTGQRSLLAKV